MKLEYDPKKEKLTKKKALFICWHLWDWIAESRSLDKSKWGEWKGNGGNVHLCSITCPCCEYVRPTCGIRDCSKCPLIKLWSGDTYEADAVSYPCERFMASPYERWKRAATKELRVYYARQIADFAMRAYLKEESKCAKRAQRKVVAACRGKV